MEETLPRWRLKAGAPRTARLDDDMADVADDVAMLGIAGDHGGSPRRNFNTVHPRVYEPPAPVFVHPPCPRGSLRNPAQLHRPEPAPEALI